jgi:hypothetical protein
MQRIIGTAAVATVAVLAATAAWAHGTADISAPQTLRLTAVFVQATIVDVDPAGLSLGDQQVGSGVLRQAGEDVGDFGITCSVDAVGDRGHWGGNCTAWAKLADGYITVAGETGGNDRHTFAVTGGTGLYRNVRGQAHVTDISETESELVIELIP